MIGSFYSTISTSDRSDSVWRSRKGFFSQVAAASIQLRSKQAREGLVFTIKGITCRGTGINFS